LGFCQKDATKPASLFIVSLTGVASVSTASSKEAPVDVDSKGCEIGNVLMTPAGYAPELVLARKEAVTFYGTNGRGPNFGIPGWKLFDIDMRQS
jgi:hypothetical protein